MREIEAASPVVWPAWCYSGDSQEGERGSSRRKGGGQSRSSQGTTTNSSGPRMTTVETQGGPVKSERLSPCGSSAPGDAASSSSRSGTPSSSYPGTPPGPPPTRLSPNTSSSTPAPAPASAPAAPTTHHPAPIKHMEAITRNYSDFMRSLAAKYNNNHPNDYFSGRNGFCGGTKTGTPPPPFLLTAPTAPSVKDQEDNKGVGEGGPMMVAFPPMFGAGSPGDMNATQVLLSMVRSQAGAHQLETYLKGAAAAASKAMLLHQEAAPLDLSRSTGNNSLHPHLGHNHQQQQPPPLKRYKRQSLAESLYGYDLTASGLLLQPRAAATAPAIPAASLKRSPSSPKQQQTSCFSRKQLLTPTRSGCLSVCSTLLDKACTPDSQTVASWTVDDVVSFVSSLDMCAEYASNFREQKIDGSALPLLTEEHLTSTLGMKLGPALKLRSILSSRLGQCSVCLHCAHCHQEPPANPQPPADIK